MPQTQHMLLLLMLLSEYIENYSGIRDKCRKNLFYLFYPFQPQKRLVRVALKFRSNYSDPSLNPVSKVTLLSWLNKIFSGVNGSHSNKARRFKGHLNARFLLQTLASSFIRFNQQ